MPQILAVAGNLSLSNDSYSLSLENLVYEGGLVSFRDYRVLDVQGADAQAFLNNQGTKDLSEAPAGSFVLNAVLDLSAKVVAFFYTLKESEEKFYLLVHQELCPALVERLEKYLIAEDVEINDCSSSVSGIIGVKSLKRFNDGFHGTFAEEDMLLTFNRPELPEVDEQQLLKLLVLTGHPLWKLTMNELELFNNTRLADLAYDKDKGCFLGQETVSKIETRRGAAYKPVALIGGDLPAGGEPIKVDGKKIGKSIASTEGLGLASINRENRIDGRKLYLDGHSGECAIHYLPLYSKNQKAEDFYHHGVELFGQGDENEAELYILKAIECDPVFEEAYESLGVLYGRQERFEEAIEFMQKLSELNPKSVMAHTNMSLYYMKVGEIDKAEEQKSKATVKQFQQLGDEAAQKRKMEEAERRKKEDLEKREEMFREVLEIDPDDTLANFGLGEIEREKGNFELSINHYKKAIESKKNYSVAWLGLGKSHIGKGETQKAREVFNEGIAIASKNGDLMPANEMQRLLGELS